jgi:RNA polymerase sigma-70 factor (ECF subfamily)
MRATTIDLAGVSARAAGVALPRGQGDEMTRSGAARETQDGADLAAETKLIDAIKSGDSTAFDALVGRYMRRAFSVAYRVLGQRQDAEDVVQESFLAALQRIETFERGRPFGPWLLRIVANRAINWRKSRTLRHTEPIPDTAVSAEESPAKTAERSELRGELARALARLPAQQRWIVALFEIDGFSGAEIADMLEMAPGTVRWHLHEARQALRKSLGHLASRTP